MLGLVLNHCSTVLLHKQDCYYVLGNLKSYSIQCRTPRDIQVKIPKYYFIEFKRKPLPAICLLFLAIIEDYNL